MQATVAKQPAAKVDLNQIGTNELNIILGGNWQIQQDHPSFTDIEPLVRDMPSIRISFNSQALDSWDTSLLIFLSRLFKFSQQHRMEIDYSGLPNGVHRLMDLASTKTSNANANKKKKSTNFITELGNSALDWYRGAIGMLAFLGEIILSLKRFILGKAQYRKSDFFLVVQEVGPQALGIVSLISFLVGLILAYMGAIQLSQFGAQIFVADLVAIGMVREIGALMTGIIVAGRTGAAFAAQLGTMQVNEEIDAFKTLGISPMDFLVLPRLLALVLMIPLLTIYSGIIGILAGSLVGYAVFDIGIFEYYHQTVRALDLNQFAVGIAKGTVYGILVAYAGCLRGIQCGRSAQAVGQAATSAVVTGILLIVIFASLLTILFHNLGI
ncbi:phospholipid/cholesterol/gamma-HCH transport system permease protein [Nitrosomonas sp. Nm84]|uniref:MlaE family ABC transporter permease n=1 Tax=Nitrosomonas sp. Nm84 TaxID=200124 RepID=UPI000D7601A5|nr:ABC transporter permease [Nitrosomonas sp. Nm84]PXW91126.1 phospholipid/cholesterol/gamma-HCH transport system permease protein [Nitrosomonas sp. Nm84]